MGVPLDRTFVDRFMVLLHQVDVIVHHLVVQRSAVDVEGLGGAATRLLLGQEPLQLGYSLL